MRATTLAEDARRRTLTRTDPELGQYFTPAAVADLVAAPFKLPEVGTVRVLDPGAGVGSLTAALVERVQRERPNLSVRAVCVETDERLLPALRETLAACGVEAEVVHGDVLDLAAHGELTNDFDLVVMNPPYAKLRANSSHRLAAQQLGVDVPNIYAAFMAAGYLHLKAGGQMSAIVPRSWANGAYFKRFRQHLLRHCSIDLLHTFAQRGLLFGDAGVLQENVIVAVTRGGDQGEVALRNDLAPARNVPAATVVSPDDPEFFLRIPSGGGRTLVGVSLASLEGVRVFTGKVVDFRARQRLTEAHAEGSVPLIYPGNVTGGTLIWPRHIGKPQGFRCSPAEAPKWLSPSGVYVVVKRFSAKEERRRVVAAVHEADTPVAHENHTNVFACPSRDVAVGLALYLNSTALDDAFREFSGHTQVNATDLRSLPYPPLDALARLGQGRSAEMPDQETIDHLVEPLL